MKRVIGVPGDRIHLRNGQVFRNGEKLDEPYVIHTARGPERLSGQFPAVPPSEYNRLFADWQQLLPQNIQGETSSCLPTAISRWATIGTSATTAASGDLSPRKMLSARPMFIYWSFETPPNQYLHTALSERAAFSGTCGHSLF